MATKEEKEKAAQEAAEAEAQKLADEKEAAELQAESDRVEKERLEKAEEKRKAREGDGDKMFSRAEVLALIKQAVKDNANGVIAEEDLDEEDPYKQKKLRLPRFQNKFIFGFKNTNVDEYFPDAVIHAFNVFNPESKQQVPYVTIVFEDATELNLPLETIIKRSQKVWVDIIEIVEKDISYSAGKTERAEVKDYSRTGTGVMVKMKVTQADYKYKVRLPDGKEVIVGPEVINW